MRWGVPSRPISLGAGAAENTVKSSDDRILITTEQAIKNRLLGEIVERDCRAVFQRD